MRAKRRVSAAEFDSVRPLLKISPERIEAARAVLVQGLTLQSVGERYGWSRQSVGDAVASVWRTLESYRESQRLASLADTLLPPGWDRVTLIAPTQLIERFRNEIAELAKPPELQSPRTTRLARTAAKKKSPL